MNTISWQNQNAPFGWTLELGTLSTDASSITLSQGVEFWSYPAYLIGLSASGAVDGYCIEYGGQLINASGCSLLATLPGGAPGATYQFALSEPLVPIAQVIVGAYGATGGIGNISYTAVVDPPPSAVDEPSMLGLFLMALCAFYLIARWRIHL